MYYAILAYHQEGVVESWTKEEDEALMVDLLQINDRLVAQKSLGPAARLGPTEGAVTLRGKGEGMLIDGPFAETKEQLLGFYVVDFPTIDGAVAAPGTSAVPTRRRSTRSGRSCFTCRVLRWRRGRKAEGSSAAEDNKKKPESRV